MRLQQLLEATYGPDDRYSEQDVDLFATALQASFEYAKSHGIQVNLAAHFFDQQFMKRERGYNGRFKYSKITHSELISTLAKVLTRGLRFFKDKEPGTNYVFFDQDTQLNVPLRKAGNNRYTVPSSIIKDRIYYGNYQKIVL
jgi:hypothetical protein